MKWLLFSYYDAEASSFKICCRILSQAHDNFKPQYHHVYVEGLKAFEQEDDKMTS